MKHVVAHNNGTPSGDRGGARSGERRDGARDRSGERRDSARDRSRERPPVAKRDHSGSNSAGGARKAKKTSMWSSFVAIGADDTMAASLKLMSTLILLEASQGQYVHTPVHFHAMPLILDVFNAGLRVEHTTDDLLQLALVILSKYHRKLTSSPDTFGSDDAFMIQFRSEVLTELEQDYSNL
jgi:hypothetical protein